jgi:hypothetical protein
MVNKVLRVFEVNCTLPNMHADSKEWEGGNKLRGPKDELMSLHFRAAGRYASSPTATDTPNFRFSSYNWCVSLFKIPYHIKYISSIWQLSRSPFEGNLRELADPR